MRSVQRGGMSILRRFPESLFVFALAAAVYLAVGRPPGTADTLPTALLPVLVLKDGSQRFDAYLPAIEAEVGEAYFLRETPQGLRSAYPVAPALLLAPFYAPFVKAAEDRLETPTEWLAWARAAERIAAALVTALGVALFSLLARALAGRGAALALTLIYALGTSAFSLQAQALWQHTFACVFLIGALLAAVTGKGSLRSAFVAAICLALMVATRRTSLVIALPIGVWMVLTHRRSLLPLALVALTGGLALLSYNLKVLGSLTGGDPSAAPFRDPEMLGTLAALLISPARGLLVYFPLALFSALGWWLGRRREGSELRTAFAIAVLAQILLIWQWRWNCWWGGHCFGPRYLAETLPLLTLLLAPLLTPEAWAESRFRRAGLAFAAMWGFLVHGIGAALYPAGGWDAVPVSVDRQPERCWDLADNPLHRALSAHFGNRARKPETVKDWRARYRGVPDCLTFASGDRSQVVEVEVRNPTERSWSGYPKPNGSRLMTMGWQILDADGPVVTGTPQAILKDIAPGGTARCRLRITPPEKPGHYLLRIGLVQESVGSFEEHGVPPASAELIRL